MKTVPFGPPVKAVTPKGTCVYVLSIKKQDQELFINTRVLRRITDEEVEMAKKKAAKKPASTTKVGLSGFELGTQLSVSLLNTRGESQYSSASSYLVLKCDHEIANKAELHSLIDEMSKIADDLVAERVRATASTVNMVPATDYRQDKELSKDDIF